MRNDQPGEAGHYQLQYWLKEIYIKDPYDGSVSLQYEFTENMDECILWCSAACASISDLFQHSVLAFGEIIGFLHFTINCRPWLFVKKKKNLKSSNPHTHTHSVPLIGL